ncbi:MAG: hypothetical protein AB3N10_07615 [Allomuricauda sp.]
MVKPHFTILLVFIMLSCSSDDSFVSPMDNGGNNGGNNGGGSAKKI